MGMSSSTAAGAAVGAGAAVAVAVTAGASVDAAVAPPDWLLFVHAATDTNNADAINNANNRFIYASFDVKMQPYSAYCDSIVTQALRQYLGFSQRLQLSARGCTICRRK